MGKDALQTIIPHEYRGTHYTNVMPRFTGEPRLIKELECTFTHYDGRRTPTKIKILELYSIIGPLGAVTVSERRIIGASPDG